MDIEVHPDAERDFLRLDRTKLAKLRWWAKRLRIDPTSGDQIRRNQIPKTLRKKYGLTNLWRTPLPDGHRALYTVATNPPHPPKVVFILILDHKRYDRLFGYKKA